MTTQTHEAQEVLKLPISKIDVDDNHRKLDLDIENLTASIKAAGLRQPISVAKGKKGRFRLVYGHRRLEACKALKWEVIRAENLGELSDEDVEQLRTVENLDRKDLLPVEEAIAVAAIDCKLQESMPGEAHRRGRMHKIAGKLGKPLAFVVDRLYLIDRCTKKTIMMALRDSRITVGHLRELAKVGDKLMQENICDCIVEERKSFTGQRRIEHVNIQTIEDLRVEIDSRQRSLDRVPWLLDQKCGKLPACIGCPSNTATDETLFGTDHKGGEVGFCMNDACYRGKEKQIETAKKNVAAKISKMKEPVSDKAVVEAKCPPYLKVATAQRYVKANVKKIDSAKKKEAKKTKGKSKKTKEPEAKKGQKRQKELEAYEKEYYKWGATLAADLNKAAQGLNPLAMLAAFLIDEFGASKGMAAMNKLGTFQPIKRTWNGSETVYRVAPPARALSPGASMELTSLMNTKPVDIEKMTTAILGKAYGHLGALFGRADNPHLMMHAAKLLEVKVPEMPEPPEPQKAEPKPKPKPKAAKKKAGKKKAAKKKPAKKKKKAKKHPAKKKAKVVKKRATKRPRKSPL